MHENNQGSPTLLARFPDPLAFGSSKSGSGNLTTTLPSPTHQISASSHAPRCWLDLNIVHNCVQSAITMLRKICLLLCNLLLMRSVHARKANKRSRSANIDILYNYEENEELSTRAKTWNYLRAIELVSKYWCLINADIVNSFESFSSYYLIVTHLLISVAETSALKHFPKYSPQPQYRKGNLLSINLKIEKG